MFICWIQSQCVALKSLTMQVNENCPRYPAPESFTETVGVITGKGLQTHSGSFGGKVGARPRTAGHKSGPSVYRPIRPATAGPRTHGASSRVPKKRGTRAKPNKGMDYRGSAMRYNGAGLSRIAQHSTTTFYNICYTYLCFVAVLVCYYSTYIKRLQI